MFPGSEEITVFIVEVSRIQFLHYFVFCQIYIDGQYIVNSDMVVVTLHNNMFYCIHLGKPQKKKKKVPMAIKLEGGG